MRLVRCVGIALVLAVMAVPASAARRRGISVVRAPTGGVLRGRNWLLIVAIGRYSEWPPLRGPRKDAGALSEVLLSRYAFEPDNVVALYDDRATNENINLAFRDLGRKLGPDDSLLVYYAIGHNTIQPTNLHQDDTKQSHLSDQVF